MARDSDDPRLETPPPVWQWLESAHLNRISSHIASRLGLKAEDAADLLQELRLALWQAGPTTRVNATWVFRTAMHKGIDMWRQTRRAQTLQVAKPRPAYEGDSELRHLLHARASALPRYLRALYELRFEQGLSQRQTAVELGIRRASVRSLDHRCLDFLFGNLRSLKALEWAEDHKP
jgi:RNA polymerase sigma factor (sigma-70 family)